MYCLECWVSGNELYPPLLGEIQGRAKARRFMVLGGRRRACAGLRGVCPAAAHSAWIVVSEGGRSYLEFALVFKPEAGSGLGRGDLTGEFKGAWGKQTGQMGPVESRSWIALASGGYVLVPGKVAQGVAQSKVLA